MKAELNITILTYFMVCKLLLLYIFWKFVEEVQMQQLKKQYYQAVGRAKIISITVGYRLSIGYLLAIGYQTCFIMEVINHIAFKVLTARPISVLLFSFFVIIVQLFLWWLRIIGIFMHCRAMYIKSNYIEQLLQSTLLFQAR